MADTSSEEDVFNILLATDIHLGYAEKDAIRGNDSFNTFEEILQFAQDKDVDFILLGGDLFHDSKPSPSCLHKCMALLRKYCMGDKPICVEFLSDQNENFKHCVKQIVNYEDPNLNISIPVYSIHGNHDDPSGIGRLSALDLLSVGGFVNYFGKWTDLSQVRISPLLLRKGRSKLAIYGLSHIKDERLARLFRDGLVTAVRPKEDDWLNIMVLHQNRADRGPNNFIAEKMLPDFLDLVFWGHEHECRIDPEWNDERGFFVTQPGSPVATSLCEGEAVLKQVGLLKVSGKKFKLEPIQLKTVRPFVFSSIDLAQSSLKYQTDCHNANRIASYVTELIEGMLEKVGGLLTGHPMQPTLPLLRLRVEYSEKDDIFNAIRFGQQFTDRVANPTEVILLKRAPAKKREKAGDQLDKNAIQSAFEQGIGNVGIDTAMDIQAVLERYFEETEDMNLKVLSVKGMAEAVSRFIDKDDKDAINDLIMHQVKQTSEFVKKDTKSDDTIMDSIEMFRQLRVGKGSEEGEEVRKLLNSQARRSEVKGEKMDVSADNEIDGSGSDSEDGMGFSSLEASKVKPKSSPSKRGRGSRARGRGSTRARGTTRGRGAATSANNTTTFNTSTPSTGRQSSRSNGLNVSRSSTQACLADMFQYKSSQPSPSKRRKMEFVSDSD